jgi:hypothetical protein
MSSTFIFQVVFEFHTEPGGQALESPNGGQAVIVEIEAGSKIKEARYLPGEAARQFAKELAPQLAMQVVQKDLPHGYEPPYSLKEIDRLPRNLHHQLPKFLGNQFRAWLL